MRAPYQILAIPYKIINGNILCCILHRADTDHWQFIAGGGEDKEIPIEAARREIFEEVGIEIRNIIQLDTICFIPANCISEKHRKNWSEHTYVIPEYSFAFKCGNEIILSKEHAEYKWVDYKEANKLLTFDSNKTALYELKCRLNDSI